MLKGICTTVAAPLLSVVTGTVQDASTGEAVIGAAVILQNTTYGAVADADGRFVINNVKPGTYTIEVQMLSYQRVVIEGCQIKPGENTLPLISLQPSAEEIDEVVVTTVRRLSSEAAVMQAVRNSKMVVSGVSKQMIARTQDRDAGEVVRRIPGISIIDDKFIVARGLSQRYNNVWVNDAAIPSSEADSRAFSFDLIPAGQIENIMILKSPVPEIPADFTGGFVKINTKDTPGELPFALSYSIGFNTATFGHDFLYNPGSGSDWFGCDNGKRGVRGGITGVAILRFLLDIERRHILPAFAQRELVLSDLVENVTEIVAILSVQVSQIQQGAHFDVGLVLVVGIFVVVFGFVLHLVVNPVTGVFHIREGPGGIAVIERSVQRQIGAVAQAEAVAVGE